MNTYDGLSDEGVQQVEAVLAKLRADAISQVKGLAEEAIGDLYVDMPRYIETDAWGNFRNHVRTCMANYEHLREHDRAMCDYIRKAILATHRELLIEDLNQDLVKEVERLNALIAEIQSRRY